MSPLRAALAPGTGNTFTPSRQCLPDQSGSGVGNAGGSCVRHHGEASTGEQRFHQFCRPLFLVVQVIAHRGLADAVVAQQLGCLPGVFTGDAIHRAQDAEGAQGDVLKIADRRGHQIKPGRERLKFSCVWLGFRSGDQRLLA